MGAATKYQVQALAVGFPMVLLCTLISNYAFRGKVETTARKPLMRDGDRSAHERRQIVSWLSG
jgi:hypothetical protein